MLRAVTLDFWGTLVDDRTSGRPARMAALRAALPRHTGSQVDTAYAAAWARFQEAWSQGWGLSPAALLCMALDELSDSLRPPAFQAVLAAWETAHLQNPPALLPGVHEALTALRRRGLLIGLISDTGATPGSGLRTYLLAQGVHTLFDWLTFSNETGVSKRSPQAFRATLAALGVASAEAVHVGDSPATDILGAQAAGLRAVLTLELHDRRTTDCRPDALLARFRDLPEVLATL